MKDLSFFSRRDFMKGAGALGITGVALWSGGCEHWWQKIKDRPSASKRRKSSCQRPDHSNVQRCGGGDESPARK